MKEEEIEIEDRQYREYLRHHKKASALFRESQERMELTIRQLEDENRSLTNKLNTVLQVIRDVIEKHQK